MSNQDWATEVPKSASKPSGPYEDYGWERGQSIMPEFRDPSVHTMPYELTRAQRIRQWMDSPQAMVAVVAVMVVLVAAIMAVVARQRRH